MKVPGLRTGAGREDKRPARIRGQPKVDLASRKAVVPPKKGVKDLDLPEGADTEEAAKMRKAVRAREKFMRHAGQASEFNLG
jgi:ATP-dependent RNA helicase DDX31/DBP7